MKHARLKTLSESIRRVYVPDTDWLGNRTAVISTFLATTAVTLGYTPIAWAAQSLDRTVLPSHCARQVRYTLAA